jgi:hypothetical protein
MMGESPSQISRAGGDFNLNMLGSKLLGPSASLKSSGKAPFLLRVVGTAET